MSELPASFSDLDYPGRKKPVNRGEKKASSDIQVWDSKPLRYLVNGTQQEFYTVGHLSKALGYSVQSIRGWETKGLLPKSPYRSPRTNGMVAGGKSNKGRRLWTRRQVEGIIGIARKHRVIVNRKPPTPAFAKEVEEFFKFLLTDDTL